MVLAHLDHLNYSQRCFRRLLQIRHRRILGSLLNDIQDNGGGLNACIDYVDPISLAAFRCFRRHLKTMKEEEKIGGQSITTRYIYRIARSTANSGTHMSVPKYPWQSEYKSLFNKMKNALGT